MTDVRLPLDPIVQRAADALWDAGQMTIHRREVAADLAQVVIEAAIGEVVSAKSDRYMVWEGMRDMATILAGAEQEIERLRRAAEQRDRLLEVIARSGRPPWGKSAGGRIFDVANGIAKETGYAE